MNSNRKVMLPNNNKKNNHHTLFITLIIALFVLLVVALSKARSYGSELGFNESEVSGNEEVHEDITEDSEEGAALSFNETFKEDIQDAEVVLRGSVFSDSELNETPIDNPPLLGVGDDNSESEYLTLSLRRNCEILGNSSDGYFIRYRSSYNYYINYTLLTAGTTYLIDAVGSVYIGNSTENDTQIYLLTETTYTPSVDIYIIQMHKTSYYMNISIDASGSGSGDTPDPTEPSGNDPSGNDPDPSGNDPSGNDPSGGGIKLDGDLQTYLINYFGHKDYTVYDSEEVFKEKKFFVSRYEYEVLKSLDDIKILLLCNVGILIVILFVGRRKRNAGS